MYQSHIGKCFILIPNHRYVMTWFCKSFPIKSKITCVIMDQWDFFLGMVFFLVGNLALSVFPFSLSLWLAIKGRGQLQVVVFFFSCLLVTIMYCSDIVWSKDLYVYFVFFRSLIENVFFFFCFLPILIGNFLLLLSSDLWSGTFFSIVLSIFQFLLFN